MKKKERPILIIIGNNKNGGIARRAAMLANGFSDAGRDATIVITKDNSENSFFELKSHVHLMDINHLQDLNDLNHRRVIDILDSLKIKVLKTVVSFLPKKARASKLLCYKVSKIRKTKKLRYALMKFRNPVIIALGFDYAIDSYYATLGIKRSLFFGTRTFAQGEIGCIDRDIAQTVLSKMKCVICQTQCTAESFRVLGAREIRVIGNPLQLSTPAFYGARKKVITNFCRISKEKRLDLLFCAFAKFHKYYPGYRIEIYGNIVTETEEKHREELMAQIKDLGLENNIFIYPSRKDILEVVKDAAMFISTSDFEGLSNTMIEAMALGLPCICTDCDGGGAREMIVNEVNGLLIPKNDETALVQAMIRFADNQKLAESCGREAVKIREKLAIEQVTSRWIEVVDAFC